MVSAFVGRFVGGGEQAAGSIQRIVSAAPMTQRFVLDPAAASVELGVDELDEMERVGHLHSVGQDVLEGLAMGARQVQHPVADRLTPLGGTSSEPPGRSGGAASRDDVEKSSTVGIEIHDRGAHRRVCHRP